MNTKDLSDAGITRIVMPRTEAHSAYWMVVYRPKGSQTWTPWDSALHWHATRDAAMADIHKLLAQRRATSSRDKFADLEFAPAKVEVVNE
jgi:hypothetical protein